MQKTISLMIVSSVLFLTSCQSNRAGSFLSPYPYQASGMTLTQAVQDALAGTDDPVLARVRVEANQNTVILSGYVKKIRQSDVAEQLAREVPGVQSVENHLIVRQ